MSLQTTPHPNPHRPNQPTHQPLLLLDRGLRVLRRLDLLVRRVQLLLQVVEEGRLRGRVARRGCLRLADLLVQLLLLLP